MRAKCQFESCGAEFEAARTTARFCSEKCKKAAQRAAASAIAGGSPMTRKQRKKMAPVESPVTNPPQIHEPDPPAPPVAVVDPAPKVVTARPAVFVAGTVKTIPKAYANILAKLPSNKPYDPTKPQ